MITFVLQWGIINDIKGALILVRLLNEVVVKLYQKNSSAYSYGSDHLISVGSIFSYVILFWDLSTYSGE